jgi:hypothetical protein
MLLAVFLAAGDALAYCRTRTCEFRREGAAPCTYDPVTWCSLDGEYVYWPQGCIPFAVQRAGSVSDDISAATLEAIVEDAFRVWSEVPCSGGSTPELAAGSQGPIRCDAVEYDCKLPEENSNLIMFRDDFIDMDPGLNARVLALTTLTANLRTGELFDADIEINTRDEDFALDAGGGIDLNEPSDLRGVVYHELGHLLGLSHSLENGALMRAAYEGTVEPQSDDIEGICAALSTGARDPICNTLELGADAGCLGHDVSCTRSRPAAGEPEPRGCACELVGTASGSSSPAQRGAALAWVTGALLFRRLRRSFFGGCAAAGAADRCYRRSPSASALR